MELRLTLSCFLLTGALSAPVVSAQEATDEHHYLFAQQGLNSTAQEKRLIEHLRAVDPEAVISVQPQGELLKVRTNIPLDVDAFLVDAGTLGIQLQPRPVGRTGRLEVGEQDQ